VRVVMQLTWACFLFESKQQQKLTDKIF